MDKAGNKTGGRAPGTPNKRTQALWDQLHALGFEEGTDDDPLILMWRWMSGRKSRVGYVAAEDGEGEAITTAAGEPIWAQKVLEPASDEVRMHLAKELAPYLYAKLKSMEVSGPNGKDLIPARVLYPRSLAAVPGPSGGASGGAGAASGTKPQAPRQPAASPAPGKGAPRP